MITVLLSYGPAPQTFLAEIGWEESIPPAAPAQTTQILHGLV